MTSKAAPLPAERAERSAGLAALFAESLLNALLPLLDARGLASLRRAGHLGSVAREAEVAEARAVVLELLQGTKFPFTHNCYVLGLNGPYYSLDTVTERHYGIPRPLPALLCRYFRLESPRLPFTTLRIQKFAASANFGGQHRTLAFSLGSQEARLEDPGVGPPSSSLLPAPEGRVICLTSGCAGGHAELAEDEEGLGPWRRLTGPQVRPSWVAFPSLAWLRWHWPTAGSLYAVTVTCESLQNCAQLRQREMRTLASLGFAMPREVGDGVKDSASEEDSSPKDPAPALAPPNRRPRARRVQEARRILGLLGLISPTGEEVDAAFRRAVRLAHPDQAGDIGGSADVDELSGSWRVSQIVWARRVLQEVVSADAAFPDAGGEFQVAAGDEEAAADEIAQEEVLLALPEPEEEA